MRNVILVFACCCVLFSCETTTESVSIPLTEIVPLDTSWCDPSYGFPEDLAVEEQTFLIDPEKPADIKCKEGTRIVFHRNTLRDKKGDPVKGNVKLEVKECYTMFDFFTEKLSTVSNGRLLESGGMVHISATCNGEEVVLAEGSTYDLLIPKEKNMSGMKTFYGNRDEVGNMNWQVGTNALTRSEFEARPVYAYKRKNWNGKGQLKMTAVSVPPAVNRGLRIIEDDMDTVMLGIHFKDNFESSEALWNYLAMRGNISLKFEFDTINGKMHTFLIEDPQLPKELRKELLIYFQTLPELDINAPGPFSQEFQFRTIRNNKRNKAVASALQTYRLNVMIADSTSNGFVREEVDSFSDLDSSSTWYGNNYFVLVPSSFGWINCDRFLQTGPTQNVLVALPDSGMQVCMIFGEWNSMIMGYVYDRTAQFGNVPQGIPVKIVAVENHGFPSMSILRTEVKSNIAMQPSEPAEFADFVYEMNHY